MQKEKPGNTNFDSHEPEVDRHLENLGKGDRIDEKNNYKCAVGGGAGGYPG